MIHCKRRKKDFLMSLSGMVEIPRLEAKRGFVMPAQAGIHLRSHC
jgi:hypothetical protein